MNDELIEVLLKLFKQHLTQATKTRNVTIYAVYGIIRKYANYKDVNTRILTIEKLSILTGLNDYTIRRYLTMFYPTKIIKVSTFNGRNRRKTNTYPVTYIEDWEESIEEIVNKSYEEFKERI